MWLKYVTIQTYTFKCNTIHTFRKKENERFFCYNVYYGDMAKSTHVSFWHRQCPSDDQGRTRPSWSSSPQSCPRTYPPASDDPPHPLALRAHHSLPENEKRNVKNQLIKKIETRQKSLENINKVVKLHYPLFMVNE